MIRCIPLLFVLLFPFAGQCAQETNRYNVLFIAVDDLRPELGCYGVAEAQTPQLDAFSNSAVLFRNHYVQVPTCGSSRYALLSGRSPGTTGALGNGAANSFKREQLEGAQSMPELFRRSGYHTVCIGKISHQPDGRVFAYNGKGDGRHEVPHAWDELPTPFGAWKRGWGTFFAYANGLHREDGKGNKDLMEFVVKKDADLPDGMMADTAIEHLARFKKQDKPFFLGLGFYKPHLPFVAPKQDWDAFDNVDLSIKSKAALAKPKSAYTHGSGEFYKYKAPYEKTKPLSPEATQQARRAYYACVRYVDRQIGRVLDALKKNGLAENTIVVVWGDHGWHLGEQQQWGKHTPYERALRSVLMVRVPGKSKARQTTSLADTIDLYPTLIDACKPTFNRTSAPLDGVSLLPVLTGESDDARQVSLSYWGKAVSIRSKTHRLIARKGQSGPTPHELVDLRESEDNMINILDKHPEIASELIKLAK
jgi:arylsulfatase A-like enzyme